MAPRWPGRRASSGRGGSRRFAAAAGPRGVHMVEYVRGRQAVEVVAGVYRPGRPADARELAALLADAVGALGGRGGELALGMSGFGSAHHVLTLPDADEDVLRPVVGRELMRYYPDLEDPVVDFVRAAEVERGPEPRREVLVGAVPRDRGHELHSALMDHRIRLRHLTVLPQVMQSVFTAFDDSAAAAVLLLSLESGPLIGCFHGGALRLFIEPPLDLHGRPIRDPTALAEQVERAMLFLRQQFPGSGGSRVLLAVDEDGRPALRAALETSLDLPVHELPGSASALAAMGAALSAEAEDGIELLPDGLRPLSQSQRWTRRLAATAAAVIALAALVWSGSALAAAVVEADRVRSAEVELEARMPWVDEARVLLERRQAHEHRLLFLDRTAATRAEIRRILAAVAAAAEPAVRLESLRIEPVGDGWHVVLSGRATGAGSAAAVRAVDALYRGVPERLPVTDVDLEELEATDALPDAPVAIAFNMSFIVRQESDLQR